MSPIRVLVVDDSVVVRRLVTDVLSQDSDVEVVGFATNGRLAVAKVAQLAPDLVTMDIEMPEMNGLEAVRAIRRAGHKVPIIMFSTLTERGAMATLDALAAGAQDYVTKPANVGSVQESLAQVADNLIPKIKALVARRPVRAAVRSSASSASSPSSSASSVVAVPAPPAPRIATRPEPAAHAIRAVVLGSSTGGPEALSRVVAALTHAPPVPVLVVQHMPPVFTKQLAARLDRLGPATVVEAESGTELLPGTIYIAPGDRHLEVQRRSGVVRTLLTDGPPVNYCRPSVDVLFGSAARVFGGELLGIVLTGMGSDGRTGCQKLVDAGGTVLVQDEPSSVVWGMPGAVAHAGLAHRVIPLVGVVPALERMLASTSHGDAPSSRGGVA
ncbi:chemotaxis response regulator protein-glutamate methylesterase [Cellulomonas sp. URHD0024]|uniref:protein-glutamate methylesterase/protein-glutamine glutaminase n=1 Tax=Cellulomonas sp. URHD0024 TaxID=1302620 RepID=UPI0003FB92DB|nr:chemotaxis response regulator protein-glutamate methylesterase [Cellulomonas sp. URHD0024]